MPGREPEEPTPAASSPTAPMAPRTAHVATAPSSRSFAVEVTPGSSRRSPWWRRPGVQGFVAGCLLAVLGVAAVITLFDDGSTVSSPQEATPSERAAGGTAGAAPTSESSAPGVTTPVGPLAAKVATPSAKATTPSEKSQRPAAKKAAAPPPRAEAEPRRFAWAPVDGATRYHVELFRGSERVLARETVRPTLELGTSWRHEGRVVRLTPGQYRWYVWPVTSGGRATKAIVQARLAIP